MSISYSEIKDAREVIARTQAENQPVINWTALHCLCDRLQTAISRSGYAEGEVMVLTKVTRYGQISGLSDPPSQVIDVQLHGDKTDIFCILPRFEIYLNQDKSIEVQLVEEIRKTAQAWSEFADTVEAILQPEESDPNDGIFDRGE